jgi:hypothetical protein
MPKERQGVVLSPTYWLDLFTGTTWEEFLKAGGEVSGFRESRWPTVQKMKPGDRLLCYVTGISRWIGMLEVTGESFMDKTRIWVREEFPCRVPVKVLVQLQPDTAVPVRVLSERLSYFSGNESPNAWTGHFRASLVREKDADAQVVVEALEAAKQNPISRPINAAKWNRQPRVLQGPAELVTVPEETPEEAAAEEKELQEEPRISHEEMQWLLLKLGSEMGFGVWVARNDRGRSYKGQPLGGFAGMRDSLPTQFDPATNRTIELIDVLWLDGNAIAAAFEVEHTTSIYSGLLRMADLVAMQPNLNIRLFIVAPDERRDKVLEEIARPTFSRMKTPLYEHCQYISYSELKKKEQQLRGFLQYLRPEFLEEIAESATPAA